MTEDHGSDFSEFLHILNPENTGTFNRVLAHAIGLNEAIVFSALIAKFAFYRSRGCLDEDGCFYATADDLQESTCLSRRQQEPVIDNLVKTGLIEVKVKGMPARRHFKIFCNPENLKKILQSGAEKIEEIKSKTPRPVSTKSENKIQQNVETSFNKMSKQVSTKSENMFQQNVEENISYKHKLKNISNKTNTRAREKPPEPPDFVLPDWIPKEAWDQYVEMRKARKKELTLNAANLVVEKLDRFREQGLDVESILKESVINCWTGVYAQKPDKPPKKLTIFEQNMQAAERAKKMIFGEKTA